MRRMWSWRALLWAMVLVGMAALSTADVRINEPNIPVRNSAAPQGWLLMERLLTARSLSVRSLDDGPPAKRFIVAMPPIARAWRAQEVSDWQAQVQAGGHLLVSCDDDRLRAHADEWLRWLQVDCTSLREAPANDGLDVPRARGWDRRVVGNGVVWVLGSSEALQNQHLIHHQHAAWLLAMADGRNVVLDDRAQHGAPVLELLRERLRQPSTLASVILMVGWALIALGLSLTRFRRSHAWVADAVPTTVDAWRVQLQRQEDIATDQRRRTSHKPHTENPR
jgi:hypothetical protein